MVGTPPLRNTFDRSVRRVSMSHLLTTSEICRWSTQLMQQKTWCNTISGSDSRDASSSCRTVRGRNMTSPHLIISTEPDRHYHSAAWNEQHTLQCERNGL